MFSIKLFVKFKLNIIFFFVVVGMIDETMSRDFFSRIFTCVFILTKARLIKSVVVPCRGRLRALKC